MQSEILAKNSSAKLKVYAIWFNMYPGDAREKWPASLLTDPRVVHLWDEQKIVGAWFGKHPDYLNSDKVLWDAFLIYKAESSWTDKPSHFVGMGRTIVAKREDLRKDLSPLLTQ